MNNIILDDTSKIRTYVGSDGKLHFVNKAGADSVLNFSKGATSISFTIGNHCRQDGTGSGWATSSGSINVTNFNTLILSGSTTISISGYGNGTHNITNVNTLTISGTLWVTGTTEQSASRSITLYV